MNYEQSAVYEATGETALNIQKKKEKKLWIITKVILTMRDRREKQRYSGSLGSPGKVAAIIKADLGENRENEGEYTERGYRDSRTEDKVHLPERKEGYHADNRRSKASVILALILLVFLTPLIKGTLGGVLGFIVALILLPFLVVFGIGAVVVALFVAAVAVTVIGIGACFSSISLGLLGTGVGLMLLAIAVVALVFLVWLASRILPEILRKFTDFCNRMLNRRRKGSD